MSSIHPRRTIAAALAATVALGAGGTALAATAGSDAPTTVTVAPAPTLKAGTIAPFDAPGVRSIRQGKAIPAGYVLIGFKVKVDRGAKMAGAPCASLAGGKRLRTLAPPAMPASRPTAGMSTTRSRGSPAPRRRPTLALRAPCTRSAASATR